MKLAHRFKNEDKMRVWLDHQYCAVTGLNDNCSIHHIFGCKEEYSDSIFNSIMLSFEEHKIADGENQRDGYTERQQQYLNYTFDYIIKSCDFYTPVKRDYEFINSKIGLLNPQNKSFAKKMLYCYNYSK